MGSAMRILSLSRLTPLFVLLAFCRVAYPQDAPVARVCVAMLRSSTDKVSVKEGRDRLVKELNHPKGEKDGQVSVKAIALEASFGSLAISESGENDCQFLLVTRLTEVQTSDKIVPADMLAQINTISVTSARVIYQLKRVADARDFSIGVGVSHDASSMKDAFLKAVVLVAASARSDLSKGGDRNEGTAASEMSPADLQLGLPPDAQAVCRWLPRDISHGEALRGACVYAIGLKQSLPNFICDQETSRYTGNSRVPHDLITALVRYESGRESYSDLEVNGRPTSSTIMESPGLWSTGEFGGNLRAIFDLRNRAVFQFAGEKQFNDEPAWVFTYDIAKQNDALWLIRGGNRSLAPAYNGELWIDENTGMVLRFRAVAKDIPLDFPTASAEISTDYRNVSFADGAAFLLPVEATVATELRAEESTHNVLEFKNCHKFRAKTRILADVPGQAVGRADAEPVASSVLIEKEQAEKIYAILREQAIREDEQRMASDQRHDLDAVRRAAMRNLHDLQEQRDQEWAKSQAETQTAHQAPPASSGQKEATIKVEVNLVPVSVVTRDTNGRAVGNLVKENFQLFDERILQLITRFSVQTSEDRESSKEGISARSSDAERAPVAAEHHVAYVFDDLHASLEELEKAKKAAGKHVSELRVGDRAAIFATSGKVAVDFTDSRETLQGALRELKPRGRAGESCPPMSYYEADLIVNQGDSDARDIATGNALECMFKGGNPDRGQMNIAAHTAWAKAEQLVANGREESKKALQILRDAIARTSAMSGARSIVLISPGFPTLTEQSQAAAMELIELALKSGIVVNTLDVADLESGLAGEQMARAGVMADLAYGTGGIFFHNNNDLSDGFQQTADIPKYVYVLAFSPQKLDGKFHKLKVAVKSPQKLRVQARPGYYALKPATGS